MDPMAHIQSWVDLWRVGGRAEAQGEVAGCDWRSEKANKLDEQLRRADKIRSRTSSGVSRLASRSPTMNVVMRVCRMLNGAGTR